MRSKVAISAPVGHGVLVTGVESSSTDVASTSPQSRGPRPVDSDLASNSGASLGTGGLSKNGTYDQIRLGTPKSVIDLKHSTGIRVTDMIVAITQPFFFPAGVAGVAGVEKFLTKK